MEGKVILQQGNNLQVMFTIIHNTDKKYKEMRSTKYQCGAVNFQLEALSSRCYSNNVSTVDFHVIILVRFLKLFKNDDLTYKCTLSSIKLEKQKFELSEDKIWYKVIVYTESDKSTSTMLNCSFDVSFHSDIATSIRPFRPLFEDIDTADFKLCGEGGSVKVHKMVLKVSSPVLQSMLSGDWKETSEGHITVADATKETLEHLVNYIYLDSLPSTGIEQLLVIGSYFMMPDLVQKCMVKLLNKVDADNVVDLFEFAAKFKVTNLLITLLHIIQNGMINIDHISENNIIDMCQATTSTLSIKK